MNRNFSNRTIEPARLAELTERIDGPGVRRLVAQLTLYVATSAWMMLAPSIELTLVGAVANGFVQFGMFGMLHESCHQTAFRSRRLSLVAGWAAALAHPMSPALMRAFHFEHHRHTHQLDRDPELAGIPMMVDWPKHIVWAATITGVPILMARVMWTVFAALVPFSALWEVVLPFVKPRKRGRIAWEARLLVLLHGALIAVGIVWYQPLLWIYAGMVIGHALTGIYTTCEHRGLPQSGTILERTRSLVTPGWVRWLLWNMPYHAEHHGWPAVPFHALGELHREVRDDLVHRGSPIALHLRGGRAS